MEMVTTPPANYPKYPVPDDPSVITSLPSASLLPSEGTSAPSPSRGLNHQPREPRTSNSSVSFRDNTPSPQKLDTSRAEGKERSHSPRKREKNPSISVKNKNVDASTQSLDVYVDRKAQGQKDRGGRSASPRKSSRKEQETGTRQPLKGHEEPQRYFDGHFNYGSGGNLYREEDIDVQQDKETGETRPEITRSDNERRHREKGVEREAVPQRSRSQILNDRAMPEDQPTTLNRRAHREPKESRHRGGTGEESKRDTRGSSSVPPETSWNENPCNKKAPITPGPWKVPSSAKMQSQVEGLWCLVEFIRNARTLTDGYSESLCNWCIFFTRLVQHTVSSRTLRRCIHVHGIPCFQYPCPPVWVGVFVPPTVTPVRLVLCQSETPAGKTWHDSCEARPSNALFSGIVKEYFYFFCVGFYFRFNVYSLVPCLKCSVSLMHLWSLFRHRMYNSTKQC